VVFTICVIVYSAQAAISLLGDHCIIPELLISPPYLDPVIKFRYAAAVGAVAAVVARVAVHTLSDDRAIAGVDGCRLRLGIAIGNLRDAA
jgi:hypothetical protein